MNTLLRYLIINAVRQCIQKLRKRLMVASCRDVYGMRKRIAYKILSSHF